MPQATSSAKLNAQRGFTLVELVISAGLLGFLAVTATFFWVKGFDLVQRVNNDSMAIADGRAALERLARELREVKYDTAAGAYCVQSLATATQVVFNRSPAGAYSTGCGAYTGTLGSGTSDYRVTVQWSSSTQTLTLGYAGDLASPAATSTLVTQVSNFQMTYLDATYSSSPTPTASTVRFVQLDLSQRPPGAPETVTRTTVALRNR
jgi:prepilin-type N-terminal cleavage/methylation domain-containing protein